MSDSKKKEHYSSFTPWLLHIFSLTQILNTILFILLAFKKRQNVDESENKKPSNQTDDYLSLIHI